MYLPTYLPVRTRDMVSGLSAALAEFASGLRWRAVPVITRQTLRCSLLDAIGVGACASKTMESSTIAADALVAVASPPERRAAVIGLAPRIGPDYAALLNGILIHSMDFDDTATVGHVHPATSVVAAVLAFADKLGANEETMLAGLAAGYEVCIRVGCATTRGAYRRGFHPTGIAGVFGAAAAGGRMVGLSPAEINHAFGIALSQASGSMQFLHDGAWTKRMHGGWAAHAAYVGVHLAQAGFTGPIASIEGPSGLVTSYSDDEAFATAAAGIGTTWLSDHADPKPYPACRYTHGLIEAATHLDARTLPDGPIIARLGTPSMRVVGTRDEHRVRPKNVVDAQFSAYFQVAEGLLHGATSWGSYLHIGDPDLQALAGRVIVEEDPSLGAVGGEIETSDGQVVRIDQPFGSGDRRMTSCQVLDKFLVNAAYAYDADRAKEIADRCLGRSDLEGLVTVLAEPLSQEDATGVPGGRRKADRSDERSETERES